MNLQQCKRPLCGVVILILSMISFCVSWLAVKVVSSDIPLFEIIFFRSTIGTLLVGAIILTQKQPFKGVNQRLLYLRSLFGFASLALVFYAIGKIEVGDVATLINTAPFFIALFAPLFLKEKFRRDIILWLVIAFVGVVLILKPGKNILHSVSFLALIGGFLNALSLICVKKLHSSEKILTIPFYFMWTTALASIPLMLTDFVIPSRTNLILLIVIGITIGVGQILMTYAYKLGPATVISPFNYSFVIFTYLGGILFLSEVPDLFSVIGTAIVILCGVAITYVEGKRDVYAPARSFHT